MSDIRYNLGMILPFSIIISFVGVIFISSYMGLALNKKINLDSRIAKSKAKHNAESGIALTYTTLGSADWAYDASALIDTTTFSGTYPINNMGLAFNIRMESSINEKNKKPQRESFAYGSSTITNIWGKSITVVDSASMKFELETLAEYMYLTNHENAGGAPGIFGTGGSNNNLSRGKPCFGGDDILGNNQGLAGHIQTLDPMLICSSWPAPTFNNLVYITKADEEFVNSEFNSTGVGVGDPILPDFSLCGCDEDDIFLNETGPDEHPGYEIREKVCFPLSGYASTISGASVETTHDATEMLRLSNQNNLNAALKDTLIMTDIEFLSAGGYRIKRWWYLLPPYLRADILKCSNGDCNDCTGVPNLQADCNNDGYPDYLYSMPQHLEGMPTDNEDIDCIDNHCYGPEGCNTLLSQNQCLSTFDDVDCEWDADCLCPDYQEFPTAGSGNWVGDITQCDIYTESLNDFHSLRLTPAGNPTHMGNGGLYINYSDQNDQERFNANYGIYNYSQHPGGGSTRLSHFDIENIPRYFEDKGWLDEPDDVLSWEFEDDLSYLQGGSLIQDEVISVPGNEAVIYIKGGPVRVHGTYSGRYTVVTSGYDATNSENNSLQISNNATYGGWNTYRRHAWYNSLSTFGGPNIDTVRSNIWITGDLVNVDAGTYGGPPQPMVMDGDGEVICNYDQPGDCGGSQNVLGLVSSSNVIIANSFDNRNTIRIHSHIVGLNESFVMHYWQNSLTTMCAPGWPNLMMTDYDCVQNPPQADGRGRSIYGNDGNENRGYIQLWGGVIQEYRGYMMRNAPGPYNSGDIGMDKDYNYDNNLYFPPPYFPYLDDCPVSGYHTVRMSISDYGKIE